MSENAIDNASIWSMPQSWNATSRHKKWPTPTTCKAHGAMPINDQNNVRRAGHVGSVPIFSQPVNTSLGSIEGAHQEEWDEKDRGTFELEGD